MKQFFLITFIVLLGGGIVLIANNVNAESSTVCTVKVRAGLNNQVIIIENNAEAFCGDYKVGETYDVIPNLDYNGVYDFNLSKREFMDMDADKEGRETIWTLKPTAYDHQDNE